MTEPTADEADKLEQQVPPPEGEDANGAMQPGELNPADREEQTHDVTDPDDIDDEHPHDVGSRRFEA